MYGIIYDMWNKIFLIFFGCFNSLGDDFWFVVLFMIERGEIWWLDYLCCVFSLILYFELILNNKYLCIY